MELKFMSVSSVTGLDNWSVMKTAEYLLEKSSRLFLESHNGYTIIRDL